MLCVNQGGKVGKDDSDKMDMDNGDPL